MGKISDDSWNLRFLKSNLLLQNKKIFLSSVATNFCIVFPLPRARSHCTLRKLSHVSYNAILRKESREKHKKNASRWRKKRVKLQKKIAQK